MMPARGAPIVMMICPEAEQPLMDSRLSGRSIRQIKIFTREPTSHKGCDRRTIRGSSQRSALSLRAMFKSTCQRVYVGPMR